MRQYGKKLFFIITGNLLLAFGIYAFVLPNDFMLGGTTGIALAVQNLIPVRISLTTAVLNVALFLLGWRFLGTEFAASSLVSTIIYPIFMAIFEELPVGDLFAGDKAVCALFGGVMMGAGIGIVLRAGGSTGGMDIPTCILTKYKGIPVGISLLCFDIVILLMQVFYMGLDGILYSILVITLTSITANKTIVSGERKIQIMIISSEFEAIRKELLDHADCGLTLLKIETGYQNVEQKAIYSIVYANKYMEVKERVLKIDKKAFIVTTEVMDVSGRGYTLARTGMV